MEELSPRESEVLELVGRQLSNPQIAERLYISVRTVESHVASLIRKLGLADRRALVAYAEQVDPTAGALGSQARHNLPLARSSFIGREAEREQLYQMVPREALVTLTGTGGSGKTRLALELAAHLSPRFPDGVWFVELEALTDGSQVAGHTVATIGATSYPDQPASASLAQHLRAADALLVLDNCEHVIDGVATLVATLMRYCPEVHLLATSREPLALAGEVTFPVPPLAVPGTTDRVALEVLRDFDAVRLFVERARSADPSFDLSQENSRPVVEICEHLDGIPMAIELAASRVRGLTPTQIADRLSDRFHLLTAGTRGSLPRQQTLRALVDWSYDLLSERERAAWRRMSVFPVDFNLEQVEAVVPGGEVADYEVAELVDGLVSHSILSRTGTEKSARYRMLETLRSYGRDRLAESGEEGATRTRLRTFACAFAERRVVELLDRTIEGRGIDVAPTDAAEFPLFRQEIAAAVAEGHRPAARQMGALVATGMGFGLGPEQQVATIAPILELGDDDVAEGDMHLALCLIPWVFDMGLSRPALERALTLSRAATGPGADGALALALNNLGIELLWEGDFQRAADVFEESTRGTGAPAIGQMGRLARATYGLGERERALQILDDAEEKARRLGEPNVLASILIQRSRIAMDEGRLDEAQRVLAVADRLSDESKVVSTIGKDAQCVLYALSDRPLEALRLITELSDAALFQFVPSYAGIVELAVAEQLPRRAALMSGIRSHVSMALNGRSFVRRIELADEQLRATLGDAELTELQREGRALHGLDRREALREVAAEGLHALSPTRKARGMRASRQPPSGGPVGKTESRRSTQDAALVSLRAMTELALSGLCVVGAYRRYDEKVRAELRDWSQRMTRPLVTDTTAHENFLVGAAPASGTSFLVRESARSLEGRITYLELNLARLTCEEFLGGLAEARACSGPLLCLLDEIDARGEEISVYEECFSLLDLNLKPQRRAVFVLVGSHPAGISAIAQQITSRPMGHDLLDRVPGNHRFEVPSPALEDKAVIFASHLHDASRLRGEPVEEIERLALYYALSDPSLTTPRQLRDLAVAVAQNLPVGERRMRYDDLFFRGDDRSDLFRQKHAEGAEQLSGRYLSLMG